jgi:uncharacterized protein YdhG (YjbR/CyaY superfamily)
VADQFATIDEYISSFPADARAALEQVRQAIHEAAPTALETISYQMPTITLDGRSLVHFAAWAHHLGLYPVPAGDDEFERAVAPYRAAKSSVRFPLGEPLPTELVERIVGLLVRRRGERPE